MKQQVVDAVFPGFKPWTLPADALRKLNARAQALLDAINDQRWEDFMDLCRDIPTPEIEAGLGLLRIASQKMVRERKQRSLTAADNAAGRWKELESLRAFACRKHDLRKKRHSAQEVERRLIRLEARSDGKLPAPD